MASKTSGLFCLALGFMALTHLLTYIFVFRLGIAEEDALLTLFLLQYLPFPAISALYLFTMASVLRLAARIAPEHALTVTYLAAVVLFFRLMLDVGAVLRWLIPTV